MICYIFRVQAPVAQGIHYSRLHAFSVLYYCSLRAEVMTHVTISRPHRRENRITYDKNVTISNAVPTFAHRYRMFRLSTIYACMICGSMPTHVHKGLTALKYKPPEQSTQCPSVVVHPATRRGR